MANKHKTSGPVVRPGVPVVTRAPLTLGALHALFCETEKSATPHRTPNFKALLAQARLDTEVFGRLYFIEQHNTGYDGVLERWRFTLTSNTNQKLSFWADILPNVISSGELPVIATTTEAGA